MATTVLVVEDDREINELLGEYLALDHFRYLQALTGNAGIHLAAAEHPDAVILDLMLPDVDGFAVARQLTCRRATYDVPVVILSCMCQEADKEKGFENGALLCLSKPFLPDDLLANLRQALAWRAALPARVPAGELVLGGADKMALYQGLHLMVADLFARTELDDDAVGQMREAVELLNQWALEWPAAHAGSGGPVRVAYEVTDREVAWQLSEAAPGLLAEAFFPPVPVGMRGRLAGGVGFKVWGAGGISGGGAGGEGGGNGKAGGPAPVPEKWLQVLVKTGAARFEKDERGRTVRFARRLGKGLNLVAAADGGGVPVVEGAGVRV